MTEKVRELKKIIKPRLLKIGTIISDEKNDYIILHIWDRHSKDHEATFIVVRDSISILFPMIKLCVKIPEGEILKWFIVKN